MNTANKLTMLRIILVPIFMAFLMIDNAICKLVALLIFVIASVTDALDGYIARNYNQITNFGKFMDPIADKMLTTSAFVVFVALGRMSPWALVLIIIREFTVSGIRLLAATDGKVIAASMSGKIKTVSQMVAIIATILFLNPVFKGDIFKIITDILIWLSTIATVLSGIEYVIVNKEILK